MLPHERKLVFNHMGDTKKWLPLNFRFNDVMRKAPLEAINGEAETSDRQSVLVSPPEYSTIHHHKV